MTKVEETQLPGVGIRHDFVTKSGERVGVITHRTGRKELLIYDRRDPDACRETVRLDDDDSRTLAELLGGAQVFEGVTPEPHDSEGLTIDWTPVKIASACAGQTLGEAMQPAGRGATVAAIVRGTETIPTPPPDFRLQVGDTAVLVGSPKGINALVAALQRG